MYFIIIIIFNVLIENIRIRSYRAFICELVQAFFVQCNTCGVPCIEARGNVHPSPRWNKHWGDAPPVGRLLMLLHLIVIPQMEIR